MAEPSVVDASPLIILAQGGYLDLLHTEEGQVFVPRQVLREVLRPGISDAAVRALRSLAWLEVVEAGPIPRVVRRQRLDAGEEAVLAWALGHPGATAVIDDRRGRLAARLLGVPVIGTLGVIADAKLREAIPAARPVVEHLLGATDWYLRPELAEQVLLRLGE